MNEYEMLDGVKKCMLCNERKFSVEFANAPVFADKKLPVCIKCYRTDDGQAVVEQVGKQAGCTKCHRVMNVAMFSVVGVHAQGSLPHINPLCRECASAEFSRVRHAFAAQGGEVENGAVKVDDVDKRPSCPYSVQEDW